MIIDHDKKITLDGENSSGGENIKWLNYVANGDGEGEMILAVDDNTKSIQVTTPSSNNMDVCFYNKEGGVYLEGKKIDEANLSVSDGIELKGTDFTYDASLTTKKMVRKNEAVLARVSAHSTKDTTITNPKHGIVNVSSEGEIDQISASSCAGLKSQKLKTPASGNNISFNAAIAAVPWGNAEGLFHKLLKRITK